MIQDEHYLALNKDEQNILKWACLLHQIKRRGKPIILGNDHIFSFKSTKESLYILKEANLFSR